jgi:hypothetical protein
MLPIEFILTDAHFAIAMLAALACFAICWLYLDAWLGDKSWKDGLKWVGYGVLAIGFGVTALEVEPAFLGRTLFGDIGLVAVVLRAIGYVILVAGLALDPLQPVPEVKPLEMGHRPEPAAPAPPTLPMAAAIGWGALALRSVLPVLAGMALLLYWRRAKAGLEWHLRPVAVAFVWFVVFELLDLAVLARDTVDPRLAGVVAPFGPIWIGAHVVLAIAAIVLGRWGWRYLVKQLQTQMFIILTTACLAIFLVTTVSFTFLLMSRVQDQTFSALDTTAKVLVGTIEAQRSGVTSDAEAVAKDTGVVAAVAARDHSRLLSLTSNFLVSKRRSTLAITNVSGQVMLRAEDPAAWGDSMSSDSLVSRALVGKSTSGLMAAEGLLGPRLIMQATVPIQSEAGLIVGTVGVGFALDDAFVDGLKQTTGLAASIYTETSRTATTLLAADGSSRSVGVIESNKAIADKVLKRGESWQGSVKTAGRSYLAVYLPLRNADGAPVGMLFIGTPQILLLQAAGRSIELTFVIAVLLLLIAIVPVHFISRSLARQMH